MPKSSKTISKKSLPAISVKGVSVAYGETPVLQNISFTISPGSIAALIGPNGSGKTTLLRAILNLTEVKTGEILLFGKPIEKMREEVGYVPQRFEFDRTFPLTVSEFLRVSMRKGCEEGCIEKQIKEVGLKPAILSDRLGDLSGGQLQRVLIAQALLNNPSILFLDEPSTGIDIVGEKAFFSLLKHLNEKHGTTILLVSHDIAVVSALVDEVVCVNKKLLCAGPPKKALTEKKLSELYGSDASLFHHHRH